MKHQNFYLCVLFVKYDVFEDSCGVLKAQELFWGVRDFFSRFLISSGFQFDIFPINLFSDAEVRQFVRRLVKVVGGALVSKSGFLQ